MLSAAAGDGRGEEGGAAKGEVQDCLSRMLQHARRLPRLPYLKLFLPRGRGRRRPLWRARGRRASSARARVRLGSCLLPLSVASSVQTDFSPPSTLPQRNVRRFSLLFSSSLSPASSIAIIGIGGASTPAHVRSFRKAGARIVGVGSALGRDGVEVFGRLVEGWRP